MVLPEYSFPTRAVVNIMASNFKYNSDDNIITNTNLQYLMPHMHKELLSVIIYTYMETLQTKIKNTTAISLRSDVSVYRTHVDNIYKLAKLIDKVGNKSFIFVCIENLWNVELVGYLKQSLIQWKIFLKVT